jgi:hypothetical protein
MLKRKVLKMITTDKTPLELTLDIELQGATRSGRLRLTKTVYAGFVPQHGMELMDTEIFFRVRTTALAGLTGLKHTAIPLRSGKFIEGNRKIISKLFPKDEALLQEAIEFFTKQGWTVER